MKLTHIVAAAALAVAGSANAAIDKGTAGNGSLFLLAFDNLPDTANFITTAGLFDLGFTLDDLASPTGNGAETSTLAPLASSSIVWNFANNTVTVGGVQNTTLGTNDWTGAFNTLIANSDAADLRWVVGANDTTGFGAAKRSLITGAELPTTQQLTDQNAGNTSALAAISVANDIFTPIATKGTIGTADNGAYTFTAADGSTTRANGYMVAGDGFANNWRNANKLGGTVYAPEINGLWLADGNGAERLLGKLALDVSAQTLTFTPVPEPSTYALMGLGLVGVALVARRRRA